MIKSKYNWDVKLPEVEISDHISADLKLTPIVKKFWKVKVLQMKPIFVIF